MARNIIEITQNETQCSERMHPVTCYSSKQQVKKTFDQEKYGKNSETHVNENYITFLLSEPHSCRIANSLLYSLEVFLKLEAVC